MEQKRNRNPVFLAAALSLIFFFFAGWVYAPYGACFETGGKVKSLGLLWSYDTDTVLGFFDAMDPVQLTCYLEFLQIWDVLFAALYGVFYASWIGVLFSQRRWIWLLPVAIAVLLDWTENFAEAQMVQQFMGGQQVSAVFVDTGSVLNSAKWIATSAVFVVLGVGIIQSMRLRLQRASEKG